MFRSWALRSATRERNPADYRDAYMGLSRSSVASMRCEFFLRDYAKQHRVLVRPEDRVPVRQYSGDDVAAERHWKRRRRRSAPPRVTL